MAKLKSKAVEKHVKSRRPVFSQSDLPSYTLTEALKVARALQDSYAGGPEAPHDVAIALSSSPTSSTWRMLAGAALAYGLTTGSFSAEKMGITPLARRIVAPTAEGDEKVAFVEAALKPTIMKNFFEKFDKSKFPRDEIAKNILVEMGVPRERVDIYFEILKINGKDCGVIRETTSGPFVALGSTGRTVPHPSQDAASVEQKDLEPRLPESLRNIASPASGLGEHSKQDPWDKAVTKVFISHGRNKKILEQVKEIVRYGKFEPIVAAEKETVSKPVPDKVMDDMRSCQAAVIHVASEGVLAGDDGTLHPRINENVLIEIGAAMALYRRRFVLLVEQGLTLPSNLQGLYEVRYEGDSLDGFSTMKLLKSFNDFSS